ncbi:hypothetical protein DIJ64_14655 [Mycobacterium leprae]|uniref:Uncharacterized protein n=1 Tax=Mycobacterium leprae TaxID=1769 RepID=A0AAD0P8Z6_MYCLR|nr:hypothetical protein DIJ64_14655 [Mycobacterium leprae]
MTKQEQGAPFAFQCWASRAPLTSISLGYTMVSVLVLPAASDTIFQFVNLAPRQLSEPESVDRALNALAQE